MGKLNSKQIEFARALCIGRDGRNCVKCGLMFTKLNSVVNVDHTDGNSENNPIDGSNWQLLCHSCNVQKFHRQKYETIFDGANPDVAYTLKIGSKMEYRWIRWLYQYLRKNKSCSVDFAINTGALEIEGNPVTTKRYLMKHIQADHDKAIFRKVFVNYETMIKLTDQALDDNSSLV